LTKADTNVAVLHEAALPLFIAPRKVDHHRGTESTEKKREQEEEIWKHS
jgi:hypothetical protein